jgi:DNA polymerase-3 subunit gamma/tau
VSYQVLARKYRPQRFDEVVGQPGVTRTLRNAIAAGRIAQAFIFAGPRGVGKTTTARILAKALNCAGGPTVDPCGTCEACVEIAEGRDIDVIEIDAATHTQVDKVREVIIAGLAVRPARDRYRIFIIDEVHQLSSHSFNALLKSIEEPPPHVVFVMATTELHKIPDTIRSRSQEFEFRTIALRDIVEQLRTIAAREGLEVDPAALVLIARAAEGSMRDAESALDQAIAFGGGRVTAADVSTLLGLVGRDLLLDIVECVADEDAARVFELVERAVETGQDLKLVCRELSRVVRDMMRLVIDPRIDPAELAPEGDVERLKALAGRFSREDLLRAFDVIARAEAEIRGSAQPRYHMEMALLRWIYLRKVVPIGELLDTLGRGGAQAAGGMRTARAAPTPGGRPGLPGLPGREAAGAPGASAPRGDPRALAAPGAAMTAGTPAAGSAPERPAGSARREGHAGGAGADRARPGGAPTPASGDAAALRAGGGRVPGAEPSAAMASDPPPPSPASGRPPAPAPPEAGPEPGAAGNRPSGEALGQAFLDALRREKRVFHGAVAARARRLDVGADTITFVFGTAQRVLSRQTMEQRAVLEQIARQVAGRPVQVLAVEEADEAAAAGPAAAASAGATARGESAPGDAAAPAAPAQDPRSELRERALAHDAVQAMLDVFPAEIRDVEEIDP